MGKRGRGKKGKGVEQRVTPTARITEDLFRPYTLEEIRAAGSAVADAIGEREELQVEWKEVSELFKIRREGIDGRIAAAAKAIRGGGVTAPVDCEVRFHVPRVGLKQIWRLDTNELVREVEMSVEECQEKLFASQELAELEKMAAAPAASDSAPSDEGEKPEEGQVESLSHESAEQGRQDAGGTKRSEEEERRYEQAVAVLVKANAVSATLLQRELRITYTRAAQLIERMEERGAVSKLEAGKRQVILRKLEEEEASQGGAT